MSDLIKREDAIKALEEWAVNLGNPKMLVREDTILVLKDIPSAENKGEWVYWGKCVFPYECTQCHEKAREDYDFCPYCGARMVKGADDD